MSTTKRLPRPLKAPLPTAAGGAEVRQSAIDQLFRDRAGANVGACYRCGEELRVVVPPAKSAKRFKEMTGRSFPGPHVSLNVRVDSVTLGATVRVAGRGKFCCACAVAYMTEFNRLNQERRAN